MRKIIALSALLTTLSSPTMARDEYHRDNDHRSEGKTAEIIREVYDGIVYVTKGIYDLLEEYSTQSLEFDLNGKSVALRYAIDTSLDTERMWFGDVKGTTDWMPIRVSVQADNGQGLTLSQAQLALLKFSSKAGFLAKLASVELGVKKDLNTEIFNKDHLQLKVADIEYSDVLVSGYDGDLKIVLNAHAAGIIGETAVFDGEEYTYSGLGYEIGSSLGAEFRLSDNSTITPEVFYRRKEADADIGISGYEYNRFGAQLVFRKNIFAIPCKFSAGVARDQLSGDYDFSEDIVFAKGECKY